MTLFETFVEPPRDYTLIPFWFLNDDLDDDELRRQIDDFAAHGVYGFIPHARIGLPESIPFMSDAWLHHTKVCVDHAAKKDMAVVLYDEGMYPSGSCAGQVVAENPRYATRCLIRRKRRPDADDEVVVAKVGQYYYVNRRSNGHIRGVHYGPGNDEAGGAPPSGDILNPEAVACFFRLVLDGHYDMLGEHFGKTVKAVFTDEPDVLGRGALRGSKPWTWGFEGFLEDYLGYDFLPHLASLFERDYPDRDKYLRDWERAVNARLEQTYYAPYSKWCEDHGVALTGHPAGADDIGTEKYFHWPGQDIVWRWVEPFNTNAIEGEQSTQAKCSASAQRHYNRERNTNECFGAFGWEFTEDEMWWITNWLVVRGVNCLYPHAFYYSVRGRRRDERPPDVGPNNVWWDRYKTYADYCRRLCWLVNSGTQACHFAILGTATSLPWRAARVLFESQRDFNYLDRDTLLDQCSVDAEAVRIHDMTYQAVIVDGPEYMEPAIAAKLEPLISAGRVLAFRDPTPDVPIAVAPDAPGLVKMLDAIVPPDVAVSPATKDLRYIHLQHDEADVYLFANEGKGPLDLEVTVSAKGEREWWDPETATVLAGAEPKRLKLPPFRTAVLCCKRT